MPKIVVLVHSLALWIHNRAKHGDISTDQLVNNITVRLRETIEGFQKWEQENEK